MASGLRIGAAMRWQFRARLFLNTVAPLNLCVTYLTVYLASRNEPTLCVHERNFWSHVRPIQMRMCHHIIRKWTLGGTHMRFRIRPQHIQTSYNCHEFSLT